MDFGPKRVLSALVARLDNKPVGLAVYYFGFSGYMGEPILYLEDLFVQLSAALAAAKQRKLKL